MRLPVGLCAAGVMVASMALLVAGVPLAGLAAFLLDQAAPAASLARVRSVAA